MNGNSGIINRRLDAVTPPRISMNPCLSEFTGGLLASLHFILRAGIIGEPFARRQCASAGFVALAPSLTAWLGGVVSFLFLNAMRGDFAIELENLSKTYRIPQRGRGTFRGAAAVAWDALRGRPGAPHSMFRMFPALHPVSLTIGRGESVAIVGRNGSGKSTLLQLIAKTLEPTTGRAVTRGRVSALLELGSGFNPEFTGIENIFLNGAILGLSRDRIEAERDNMLAFADIGSFINQPVRTYSSGMRMRLAFAVITAVDPDILIIDEALSVGDAFFQSRCVRWLEDYLKRGRTFLCVSHDMFMVQRLCQRGIVLDDGRAVCDANISEAANHYYRIHWKHPDAAPKVATWETPSSTPPLRTTNSRTELPALEDGWSPISLNLKERTGDGRITIERISSRPDLRNGLLVGDLLNLQVDVFASEPVDQFNFGVGFRDRSGQLIGGYHSFFTRESFSIPSADSFASFRLSVQMNLKPQMYLLVAGIAINHSLEQWEDLDCLWDCAKVMVSGDDIFWGITPLPSKGPSFSITTPNTQGTKQIHGPREN
jgi:lipopolysaccharide transport system ATP-binding protein